MQYRFCFGLAAGAAAILVAGSASAHIQMRTPLQRDTGQKIGPCGDSNGVRSASVCEYQPGATITVTWDETIEHPGHFRISFDEDGEDDFVDPDGYDDFDTGPSVIEDDIADRNVSGDDPSYSQTITLPDIECDSCTLQLIQVMTDKPPYGDGNDIYYQCADITLSASAPADPAEACAGSGGGGDDPLDGAGDDGAEESGCAAAGAGAGSLAWLVLLLALGLRARRR
ncbi:MAG TPA: SCE4755 family polysaccharide monooxygenase-like protein [Kofleriaceae bacterium]|nr:SCE4755 family polysaccharide monooxygenase-like protein [Kofleriaceae bacterium]